MQLPTSSVPAVEQMKSVSLAETIESIAPFVPISEIWQSAAEHLGKHATTDAWAQPVVLDLISAYRRSGAAAELVDYLRKAELDARPPWRKSDAAGARESLDEEVLLLLDEVSFQYGRLLNRTDLRRADQHVYDHERWTREGQFRQAEEFCTERRGMIGFLDHYGIPHTLDGRAHDVVGQSNGEVSRGSSRSVDDNAFVSVYEVLHAVAPHIRIDAQDARDYSSNLGTAYSFGAEPEIDLAGPTKELEWQAILSAPVCRLFQESRAAERLLGVFGSGNASDVPKWRVQRLGKSLALHGLEVEGMQELMRLSEVEAQYKAAYDRFRRYSPRFTSKPKTGELSLESPMLDLPKRWRVHEIGFIRSDIVSILDSHEIRHNLGKIGGPSTADRLRAAPGKRPLTTQQLAAAFADIGQPRYLTKRNYDQWLKYLQGSLPEWAKASAIRPMIGEQGKQASTWNPVEFAKQAVLKGAGRRPIDIRAFDERFRTVAELAHWRDEWLAFRELDRQYDA